MTYAVNILKENIDQEYLMVLKPRRMFFATWTNIGGGIYSAPWTYGDVTAMKVFNYADGSFSTVTDFVKVSSLSAVVAASNVFYYDRDAGLIYSGINLNDAASYKPMVTYAMYFATSDLNWYSTPNDATTTQVHFQGCVVKAPTVTNSMSDSLFGFVPIQVSSLVCGEVQDFWIKHLYDSSFNRAPLEIYHVAGNLTIGNVQFFTRVYTRSYAFNDEQVSFELAEPQSILDQEFRYGTPFNSIDTSFYQPGAIDSVFEWRPVRRVYGVVDGFPLVNFTAFKGAVDSTQNRTWVFGNGNYDTYGNVTQNVAGSPSNTTTRTYMSSVSGLNSGDAVWMHSGARDEYVILTAVGANYVEHAALGTPFPNSGTVTRYAVGKVTILQGGKKFYPMPHRDWTMNLVEGLPNPIGIQFVNNFETTLSMNALSSSDTVVARIYGVADLPTIGGVTFGSLDSGTNSLTNGVVIIYSILKAAGIPESEIDTTTFQTLASRSRASTAAVGFAFPQRTSDNMSTYRDIILRVLQSHMMRMFLDSNGQWTLRQVGPLAESPDASYDDYDIDRDSFEYRVSYDDIASKINVKYRYRELDPEVANQEGEAWNVASTEVEDNKYLHNIIRDQDFETVLLNSAVAFDLAVNLAYLYSERRGLMSLTGKSKMRTTEISDTVEVTRTLMPGNEFDGDTTYSQSFSVNDVSRELSSTQLVVEDQKGIEDNSSDWRDV